MLNLNFSLYNENSAKFKITPSHEKLISLLIEKLLKIFRIDQGCQKPVHATAANKITVAESP